jgi:hypothetical protein
VGSAVQTADGKECVTEKGRRLVSGPLKWFYYYRRFFYQGGTHYIFFEVRSACDGALRLGGLQLGGWFGLCVQCSAPIAVGGCAATMRHLPAALL